MRLRDDDRHGGERVAPGTTLVRIACELGSRPEFLHAFVNSYAGSRFSNATAQRVTLAAYELLENALRYSSISSDVIFELTQRGSMLEVSITNESVASRIAMLERHVARLEKDAEGTYEEEMSRSVSGGIRRPMLGLARVRHEAQMQLDVTVTDSSVRVTATCRR